MSVINTIVKEKKHVKRSDGYHPVSQWTSSDTVEMSNGKTLSENTVELTQEEYDALDDSKLTDGVDYYTTDTQKHIRNGVEYGSGGITLDTTLTVKGAAADAKAVGNLIVDVKQEIKDLGIAYDRSSDNIMVSDTDGVYHPVMRAGLKKKWLIENGIMNTDLVSGLTMLPVYSDISGAVRTNTDTNDFTIASDENSIIMAHHQVAQLGNYGVTAFFDKIIDLTDYDYLYMDFSILHEGYSSGGVATSNVVVSSATTGTPYNALAYTELLACDVEANSGQVLVNVSHLSGSYYVGVELALRASSDPGKTVTCHAYNMWME